MPRGRRSVLAVLAVLAVLVVLSAGCSNTPGEGSDQPLEGTRTEGLGSARICMPWDIVPSRQATWAFEGTSNRGTGTIVVEEIDLGSSRGVRMIGARLLDPSAPIENDYVQADGSVSFTVADGWPPTDPDVAAWFAPAVSQPLVGARIPADPERYWHFALGFEVSPGARVEPIGIVYRDEQGDRYRWQGNDVMTIGDPGC